MEIVLRLSVMDVELNAFVTIFISEVANIGTLKIDFKISYQFNGSSQTSVIYKLKAGKTAFNRLKTTYETEMKIREVCRVCPLLLQTSDE
ncbi:hypothetical protein T08_8189 [Trichinella sp. T8]|nr:hypothetical protein T08_8189 [Trichinella sp. T8]